MENGLRHESRTRERSKVTGSRSDSGSTGYSRDAVKGRAYGSNAGVCLHCKHVPRSVGVTLLKKKEGKKSGWRKEHLNRAKCTGSNPMCTHAAPGEPLTLRENVPLSLLLPLCFLHWAAASYASLWLLYSRSRSEGRLSSVNCAHMTKYDSVRQSALGN